MRYILAFNFFALKPKTGWKNVFWVGLLLIIPVPLVFQMVVLGYRSFVFEDLDDDPDQRYHRDFDVNHFTDYLTRGIWPALIQFVVMMVVIGFFYAGFIAMMLYSAAQKAPPQFMLIFMAVWFVLLLLTSVALAMFLWPIEIHTALVTPFNLGGSLRFARSFLAAMWKECLAAILSFALLALVLYSLMLVLVVLIAGGTGYALGVGVSPELGFIVGMILYVGMLLGLGLPYAAILTMANGHILAQLYGVYVDKGGEPLRVRDPFEADPMLDRRDEE